MLILLAELPENIIYKLSYQIEDHAIKAAALFSQFSGKFGIVDVVGFYTSSQVPFATTAPHLLNSHFLKLVDDSVVGIPEIRHLHCTAMSLEGLSLHNTITSLKEAGTVVGTLTPAELLETILHAMIGMYDSPSQLANLIQLLFQVTITYFLGVFFTGILVLRISSI